MVWEDEPVPPLPTQLALARVRRGRRVGLLTDAFSLPGFAHQMSPACATARCIETPEGQIGFEPTPRKVESLHRPADAQVLWLSAEQSNSSLIVDDAVMLKIFRRISPAASRGRDEPLSDAHMDLPTRRRCWARWPHRSDGTPCARHRAGLRAQSGRCLDVGAEPVNRALDDHASRGPPPKRGDDMSDYHACRGDRPAARRPCTPSWRGRPTTPLSRPRRRARRRGAGSSGRWRSSGAFGPSPRAGNGTAKRSKPCARAARRRREALERRCVTGRKPAKAR